MELEENESGECDENCGDAAQPGGATSGPRGAVACMGGGVMRVV